jgi:inorganic pyrophosphatase
MGKKSGSAMPTAIDGDGKFVNVIVETPRGCRNKFKYEPALGRFTLHAVLPAGAAFPYDFGFIPGTKADDGDPIDVLVLPARLIGVIEAEQTESGKTVRNDRLVAVAKNAHDYQDLRNLADLNANLLKELEHFFVSYNEMKGRKFVFLGTRGPRRARKLLEKAVSRG